MNHYPTLLYLDNNNYLKEKYGNKLKNYIKEEIKQSNICSRCFWYFVSIDCFRKHLVKYYIIQIFEIYFYILLRVILHIRMVL